MFSRPAKRTFWPPRRMRVQKILLILLLLAFLFLAFFTLTEYFYCEGRGQYLSLAQFQWPAFVDLRAEVERQLLGEKPQSPVINDWANVKSLIQPNCSGWEEGEEDGRDVLVLVKTAPDRIEQRDAIRATFASFNGTPQGVRFRTLFVMGSMLRWKSDWMVRLEAEARRWGDLLVGRHQDDYFHSCFKLANSIKLARNFCGRERAVPFLMLLDDDYLFFPWELAKELKRHSPEERLYEGHCYFDSAPFRKSDEKWAVTHREWPFEKYPTYCSGGTVLLSGRTVEEFYLAIQHTEFFVWEDVYIGILAHLLGIEARHNPKFFGLAYKEKPYVLDCLRWHREWPDCKDWHEVISAHGYSPQEIRRIYGRISGRREGRRRAEEEDLNKAGGRSSPPASMPMPFSTRSAHN